MPTDVSENSKVVSVKNEMTLLKQVVQDPGSLSESLRTVLGIALQSQSGLAALEVPEMKISMMSLNTHKMVANLHLDGGYASLNDSRRTALASLKAYVIRDAKPGRGTLDWYKNELAEKNERLRLVADEVALMGLRIEEILTLAYQMAKSAGKENEFKRRRDDLLRRFGA